MNSIARLLIAPVLALSCGCIIVDNGGGATTTTGGATSGDACLEALSEPPPEGSRSCPLGASLTFVSGEVDGEVVDPEEPGAGLVVAEGLQLYLVNGPDDFVGHVSERGPGCQAVCGLCPPGQHACIGEFPTGSFRQCIPFDDEDPVATCLGTDTAGDSTGSTGGDESTGFADETG